MKITTLLIVILLLSCGGESHLILDSAKIDKTSSDKNKAYNTLSKGLYTDKNVKLSAIPEAWYFMGEMHLERNEIKEMLAAFDKVEELESTREKKIFTPKAKQKRSNAYVKQYDLARSKYNSSIEASDNEKMAFLKEAMTAVKTAKMIEDRVENYIISGKIKVQLNDETAVDDYKKAIEMDPKNKDVIFNLGNYYYNKKKYMEAANYYNQVLMIDPNDNDAAKFKAYSYQNDQKYKEAAAAYADYINKNPNDVEIKQYLVQMYYLSEQYDKSISLAKELISQSNENESVYDILIRAYYLKINDAITAKDADARKALLNESVSTLENAVKKDEYMMNVLIWEALEELYARQGNVKMQKSAEKKVKSLKN